MLVGFCLLALEKQLGFLVELLQLVSGAAALLGQRGARESQKARDGVQGEEEIITPSL